MSASALVIVSDTACVADPPSRTFKQWEPDQMTIMGLVLLKMRKENGLTINYVNPKQINPGIHDFAWWFGQGESSLWCFDGRVRYTPRYLRYTTSDTWDSMGLLVMTQRYAPAGILGRSHHPCCHHHCYQHNLDLWHTHSKHFLLNSHLSLCV